MADDDGYKLGLPTVRRLDRVMRTVLSGSADIEGRGDDGSDPAGPDETCWGKLTTKISDDGDDPQLWEWSEVIFKSDGTTIAKTNGRSGDDSKDDPYKCFAVAPKVSLLVEDAIVLLRRRSVKQTDGTWQLQWGIIPLSSCVMFPVTVVTDGGSNGSVSGGTLINATYTYTVSTLEGVTLGNTMTPTWNRPKGPLTAAAEHGMGYFYNGAFVLAHTDEEEDATACSDGGS